MSKKQTSTKRLRLTRLQTRAVDRYAIEELCIPGVVLMENAGRNAADCIEKWLRNRLKRKSLSGRVAIICGSGNNGGDGFVVARHLCQRGYEVSVDLLADPHSLTGDAAINHAIAEKMDISIRLLKDVKKVPGAVQRWRRCDVIVDALLGTGFSRGQVRDPMAAVIRKVNALKG
ncbi:MAG: NAD(P)H-hydrate epimerase, partial [Planctomycetota bacterium]